LAFAVCLGGVLIGFLLATTLTVNGVLVLGPNELTTWIETGIAHTESRKYCVGVRVWNCWRGWFLPLPWQPSLGDSGTKTNALILV
jgi:hypothetical protein